MMAPDYAWWHGIYDVAKNFYTELLPEVKEACEKAGQAELYEEMDRRRSVRAFSPDPVPRELIERAIQTASTAPSGAHQQPWTFVAISDPDTKRHIRKAAEVEELARKANAQHMLGGQLMKERDRYYVTWRLVEPETGRILEAGTTAPAHLTTVADAVIPEVVRPLIEERTGKPVSHLCYPWHAFGPTATRLAIEAGYRGVFCGKVPGVPITRPGGDLHRIARLAHAHGARILLDAAQLLAHAPIDVRPDDDPEHIDFLAHHLQPFRCRGQRAVLHRFQVAGEDCERRA